MKILLIRPSPGPSSYYSVYGILTPPLGLLSLAGAVRDIHSIAVVDAEAYRFRPVDVAKIIEDLDPDIVGFTSISSVYYPAALETMRLARKSRRDAIYVIGGHHPTFMFSTVLRDGFDVVVLGEGEATFRELVESIRGGGSYRDVKGIAFMDPETKEIKYSFRPFIKNIDELPLPAYDLVDPSAYRIDVFGGEPVASLETSRGCPYSCDFCSASSMWGHTWRFKSPERVLTEINMLLRLGYKWAFIVDDNFIAPVRVEERIRLLERMIEKRIEERMKFIVQIRADIIARYPWLAKLMREAGVRVAFVGIESGDPEVLRKMGKGLLVDSTVRGVAYLSRSGIIVHGGLVIGAPYESRKQRERTLRFAKSLMYYGLDSLQVSIYTPLPGARAFHKAVEERLLYTTDWYLYDALHPVMKTSERPWRLFLDSRLAMYAYYLLKWLKSRLRALPNLKRGYRDVEELIRRSTRFLLNKVPAHILHFLLLPMESLIVEAKVISGLRKIDYRGLIESLRPWLSSAAR